MFGCKCFHWKRIDNLLQSEPDYFSLPAPLPDWPPGQGFASGRINLGEIEVVKVCSLGHHCQFNNKPFRGFLLVAREVTFSETEGTNFGRPINSPALEKPLDYTLIWSSYDGSEENYDGCGFFWLPQPPEGYKPLGYLVTGNPEKPDVDEVRCVRADLTDECQAYRPILTCCSKISTFPFQVWSTRPSHRGTMGRGVSVGTFFCSSNWMSGENLSIVCLRNSNPELHSMPNLEQIHALISHYGPRVFFHPDEVYLPSSVSWFFKNGALLYKAGDLTGEPIDASGSNLPVGGTNDGAFWIDLPSDDSRDTVKFGNLESAKLYVHVKPALGGTFTDIVMWRTRKLSSSRDLHAGVCKLGIGIRNDAARSNLYVDSSTNYEIVAAEYIGGDVSIEPNWLQFMREWGPKIVYNSRNELDKIINLLPMMLRYSVENIFYKLPVEVYGEEGPTGPKERIIGWEMKEASKAMEKASKNQAIKDAIGEPIAKGPWYNASLAVAHKRHSVSCTFPVSGPRGNGVFQLKAVRNGGLCFI
ncbi:hypothetical protein GH714_025069 [Hevea brasiliensis]|uniref:Uncharacterized protein n=1 Tax=Hevea brasiliensis TaxID=3981 RepID=A0A6A6M0C5_HEVBR|nr:hypothetical protein GH714_025069 [Hevea brasiliensis]